VAIEWGEHLSTGVAWQDREHKELLKRFNELVTAIDEGRGQEEVTRLFTFLDDYVVAHFHHEEQAMSRFSYPDMLVHLEEHTHFIDDLSRVKAGSRGSADDLAELIRKRLVSWILNHLGSTDKSLGAFLRERPGERGP
jgi:hemerythrin